MGIIGTLFSSPTLLVMDVFLCVAILVGMSYTEVDWIAYMQEVQGYIGGELDYRKLGGNTGPLVYPAAFVYIYGALSFLTEDGRDTALAQTLFAGLYIVMTAFVFNLYNTSKRIPFLYSALLILSKRIHSLFVLRMFNDTAAMACLYVAIFLMTKNMWSRACFMYSFAVGIKMNIFLFAPGMLLVMLKSMSLPKVIFNLGICAATQVVLGAPFLLYDWKSYMGKAFELSRVFTYKWTVNYKFLPEDIFVSPTFGMMLLSLTVASWGILFWHRWRHRDYSAPSSIVQTLFESNLVGIIFSRTFHYQFYVWFFHQIPFVLCLSCGKLPHWLKIVIVVLVELGFNVYPSTEWSSALLQGSLVVLWFGMLWSKDMKAKQE